MGIEVASRFWGTTIDLIAPPNDSDNRSKADPVGNGGRVSSTGGAVGGGGATFWGGCATADFFVGAETGFGFDTVIDMAGNEISATSMARKGCSLSD